MGCSCSTSSDEWSDSDSDSDSSLSDLPPYIRWSTKTVELKQQTSAVTEHACLEKEVKGDGSGTCEEALESHPHVMTDDLEQAQNQCATNEPGPSTVLQTSLLPPPLPEPETGLLPPPSPEPEAGLLLPPPTDPETGLLPPPSPEPEAGLLLPPPTDPETGLLPPPLPETETGLLPPPSPEPETGLLPPPSPEPEAGLLLPPPTDPETGLLPPPLPEPETGLLPPPLPEPETGLLPPPPPEPDTGLLRPSPPELSLSNEVNVLLTTVSPPHIGQQTRRGSTEIDWKEDAALKRPWLPVNSRVRKIRSPEEGDGPSAVICFYNAPEDLGTPRPERHHVGTQTLPPGACGDASTPSSKIHSVCPEQRGMAEGGASGDKPKATVWSKGTPQAEFPQRGSRVDFLGPVLEPWPSKNIQPMLNRSAEKSSTTKADHQPALPPGQQVGSKLTYAQVLMAEGGHSGDRPKATVLSQGTPQAKFPQRGSRVDLSGPVLEPRPSKNIQPMLNRSAEKSSRTKADHQPTLPPGQQVGSKLSYAQVLRMPPRKRAPSPSPDLTPPDPEEEPQSAEAHHPTKWRYAWL